MNTPDIFGDAVKAYFQKPSSQEITVISEDFDDDVIPVSHLFRTYSEMPKLEQKALQLCKGKILDVGCCAGSHSLVLQTQNKEVTAIDISPGAIEIARLRGIKNANVQNFFEVNKKYDTILMLMNGIGIVGKLENLPLFFSQLDKILTPNGKVLVDSSDLQYLFEQDEDGGIWVKKDYYYGELTYQIAFGGKTSVPFDWLFIDANTLKKEAQQMGFDCRIIAQSNHYDFLAELKRR
ncbi:bifunctional 2-polyprenyl-6-hydroxyphenol methylase/3-demethylubiquinol 3-O-methyltransferase UbiG [Mesonia sp. K7]|uniref:class I SAM-dependent methyltransferase n=1 Tax=Mesonia sp. K7 TaxID=2218606 RepID=UPI000DA7B003|nr:methyltransferase domain-containing protein [Mesonia sp. K7]PZD78058.1 SAM-dependent methyltransferase [Mesonia sp. K7]